MFARLSAHFILFYLCLCQATYAFDTFKLKSDILVDLQEKIEGLGENKNFAFVNLLSDDDLQQLNQFKIESSNSYDRFGNLQLLQEELPGFLRSLGENDEQLIQKITKIICELASYVSQASRKETSWVCVRASTPNRDYDIPRWHWDGYYYSPYSGFVFKFATVLKGNPTLFYQLPKDLRKIFKQHSDDRAFLSQLLNSENIETTKPGQGAFFIVGDNNRAAAHSEPKMDGERLFFSILPGNEDEINELNVRWNP